MRQKCLKKLFAGGEGQGLGKLFKQEETAAVPHPQSPPTTSEPHCWLLGDGGGGATGWSYQGIATKVAMDSNPSACSPWGTAPHSQMLMSLPKPLRQRKISEIQVTTSPTDAQPVSREVGCVAV